MGINQGILLGLGTAVSWGSADLLTRFATRSIGTLRTMLYMQFTGLVLMTLALHWLGWGHLADGSGWRPWMWGTLAGLLNVVSTLALYRAFEIGKLSIAAPISSGYPAVTMVLAAITGERLTLARFAGIALVTAGVLVVARGEAAPDEPKLPGRKHRGVGLAVFAGVGFGVLFWILGIRVVPLVGSAPGVWLIRLTSVVVMAAVMLVARRAMGLARTGSRWVLGIGILDTSAFVLANYGMQHEQLSVVSVLTSLYGAVTVGLAGAILREKILRAQWVGIVLIFAGIVAISR